MPKFLLGRIKIHCCQVEAEDLQKAVDLYNKGSKGDKVPGVGEHYHYQHAWIENEEKSREVRVATLQAVGQELLNLDFDGSKRVIIHPFPARNRPPLKGPINDKDSSH